MEEQVSRSIIFPSKINLYKNQQSMTLSNYLNYNEWENSLEQKEDNNKFCLLVPNENCYDNGPTPSAAILRCNYNHIDKILDKYIPLIKNINGSLTIELRCCCEVDELPPGTFWEIIKKYPEVNIDIFMGDFSLCQLPNDLLPVILSNKRE